MTGTAKKTLGGYLDDLLDQYAFDSHKHRVEEERDCCDDPDCGSCHGTGVETVLTNPNGYFDWYEWGGRWAGLIYPHWDEPAHFGEQNFGNPWPFVLDTARMKETLSGCLAPDETLPVFSDVAAVVIDPIKENLTGAYYVLLDFHC